MNVALILSGGTGSRLGADIPKQYIEVGGVPIIIYCLRSLTAHEQIDAIQIVAAKEWQEVIRDWMRAGDLLAKFQGFSEPGENRQLSILNGLKDIREYAQEDSCVFVHDAARPCLSADMIGRCFQGMEGHDGVLPVLPMKDTVYLSENGRTITSLLDRSQVVAGQAPEVFRLGKYYEANCRLLSEDILKINGSTEPALLAGMDIAMIPGDEGNFKITTQADFERFKDLIAQGE